MPCPRTALVDDERGDAAPARTPVEERRDVQAGQADNAPVDLGDEDGVGRGVGQLGDPRADPVGALGRVPELGNEVGDGIGVGRASGADKGRHAQRC
jgi:hypothetical protein